MNTEPTPTPAVAGPVELPVRPIAYLYHDTRVPEDAHPWLHSTMLVLAADRRPGLCGETALFSASQMACLIADALRWRKLRDTPASSVAPGPLRAWLFSRPGGAESLDKMADELPGPNVEPTGLGRQEQK